MPPTINSNFPPELIETNLHHINYYIVNSTTSLAEFLEDVNAKEDKALYQVAESLFTYLVLEEDLIPDSENGIYGFIDDAWLIHNMIYRCIEAGLQDTKSYSIDWPILIATDELILNIIPEDVLTSLNSLVLHNLRNLEEQISSYKPKIQNQYKEMKMAAIMGKGIAVSP